MKKGDDGQPGRRGLAGYSQSITRTSKTRSHTVGSSTNWYRAGTSWSRSGVLSIGGVTASVKALFNRIGTGALVTIYRDANNWADYTVSSIGYGGSATRAQFTLVYVESIGFQPSSGRIDFHFTADGDPASRGPGIFYVSVSTSQRNLLQATKDLTTLATTSLINLANGATPGDNLVGDSVRFTRTGFVKWYSWTGAQWTALVDFIGAETIVGLQAVFNTLTVNLAKVTGTLTAAHISWRCKKC